MFNPCTSFFSKKIACSLKTVLLTFTLVNVNLAVAQDEMNITIPTMSDARVFAEFKDKMPAVVNYFTKYTEQQVIAFYQKTYGEAEQQERKRGRLTLNYSHEKNMIRVVISQQNKMRQVDVIVEEKQMTPLTLVK